MSWLGAFAAQRVIAAVGRLRRGRAHRHEPQPGGDYEHEALAGAPRVGAISYFRPPNQDPWVELDELDENGHIVSPYGNVDDNGVPV